MKHILCTFFSLNQDALKFIHKPYENIVFNIEVELVHDLETYQKSVGGNEVV